MNWARGLFRTWVALAIVWLGVIGYIFTANLPKPDWAAQKAQVCEAALRKATAGDALSDEEKECVAQASVHQQRLRKHLITAAQMGLLPPVGLLLAGWLMFWIGRGFSRKQP